MVFRSVLISIFVTSAAFADTQDFNDGWNVDTFFDSIQVIDGSLSFYVRTDPNCTRDCPRAVFPGDGSNDFSDVKRRTGVDIGIMSISSGLDTLLSLKNKITNDIYTDGHVILTRNHLKKQNKYGVLFAVQSRVAPNWQLHGDARTIEEWFDAGLRVLQLQYGTKEKHDSSERLGYGTSEGDDKGLTDLGKKVVKKMNSFGMIIDVAHSNRQTTLDAAALSTFPIIATHANAESLTPINRNKSDEELVAIADTGGVICVTTIRWMLDTNKDNEAGLEDFVLHIEYMVDLVGLDHVGVATDADMSGWEKSSTHYASKELASFNRWKLLAQKLHEKGWSDEQLEKLLGGNLRRVFVGGKITTHTLKQVESPPPDNINHQFQLMIDIAKTTPGPVTLK